MIDLAGIKLRLNVTDTARDSLITEILAESILSVSNRLGVIVSGPSIVETRRIDRRNNRYCMSLPIATMVSIVATVDGVDTDITDDCEVDNQMIEIGIFTMPYFELGDSGKLTVTYTTTAAAMSEISKIVAKLTIWELMKMPAFDNLNYKKSMSDNGVGISYASEDEVQTAINREISNIVSGVIL